MADRFAKSETHTAGVDGRRARRGQVLRAAGAIWLALCLPAAGAPARLDTDGISETEIASALHRAYQLPMLVAVSSTPAQEDAAVEHERTRLRRLMVELGYLDADVTVERSPAGMVLRPVLGLRYSVGAVELKGVRQSELEPEVVADLVARVREFVGKPATASATTTFARRVLDRIGERDFALARLQAVNWVRTEDGVATASVELDTGPRSRFGSVVFSGLRRLDAADLQRAVPFREGDRYERAQVERLRDNLKALESVKSFNVDLTANEDGVLTVAVRLREAPADLSVLKNPGSFGLGSGLAALGALALAQIAAAAGVSRARVRPLVWGSAVFVLTFVVAVTPRLVSFLS